MASYVPLQAEVTTLSWTSTHSKFTRQVDFRDSLPFDDLSYNGQCCNAEDFKRQLWYPISRKCRVCTTRLTRGHTIVNDLEASQGGALFASILTAVNCVGGQPSAINYICTLARCCGCSPTLIPPPFPNP